MYTRVIVSLAAVGLLCVGSFQAMDSSSREALEKVGIRFGITKAGRKELSWQTAETRKKSQSRWTIEEEDLRKQLTVWVISPEGEHVRQVAIQSCMHRENVSYQFSYAIDWRDSLPDISSSLVVKYVQPDLYKNMQSGQSSRATRANTAAAISHLQLMDKALREDRRLVLQLEDDAVILPGFMSALRGRLNELPADWDILYLSGCYERTSPQEVGQGILSLRWSACTLGLVYRPGGAVKILDFIQKTKLNSPFDLLLADLANTGVLHSYITSRPWLIGESGTMSLIQGH